jgi:hypothetical protein
MIMSPASTIALPSRPGHVPQTDRLGLLHRGISFGLMGILLLYLSVFINQIDPKFSTLLGIFLLFVGGKRLLTPAIWPLMAIVFYSGMMDMFFPGSKPEAGVILAHPLFLLDCVLLTALVLGGQSVRRQYLLMLGILFVSLVGAVGDWMGHDMTALLPFEIPDDVIINTIILQQGDVVRIRGFFSEAGVLAAVSIGIATIVAIGSLVLINVRTNLQSAWVALLSSTAVGGAILCITVTKSGFLMIIGGFFGFCMVLLASRNPRCRLLAATIFTAMIVGCTAFMVLGPSTMTNYLRGEIMVSINPYAMSPQDFAGHSGVITRYKCWLLAFTSIRHFPLGVGAYGLGSVIAGLGNAGMTHEMRHFFSLDNFGLKNALANLIAQTGVVGVSLLCYWIWAAMIRPILACLGEGSVRGSLVAGLYGASAVLGFLFLFSCELYPSLAFLLLLKCHADAVAQACMAEPQGATESLELIG